MTFLEIHRPAVATGVTADGWITRRPGDVVVLVLGKAAQ